MIDRIYLFGKEFDADAVSASSNSNMTNVLNLGILRDYYDTSRTPNIGESGEMWLNIKCDGEDVTSAGSPVVTFDLHASTLEAMSSPDTILTKTLTAAQTLALDDGDTVYRAKLPAGTIKQYLALNIAVATAALTAGQFTAYISLESETPK